LHVLLLLLALPISLLACIVIAYAVPLPAALSESRDLVAAVGTGVAGIGYLLGLTLYLLRSIWRASRALDAVLEPLGLVGRTHAVFGRSYTGGIRGRHVEVQYTPPFALQGARLDVRVEARSDTRMAMGRQRPLLDCRDCPRVALAENLPYAIYTKDAGAARRLVAHPAARAALDRLLAVEYTSSLYVQPNRLWFRTRPRKANTGRVKRQLDALVALAGLCGEPDSGYSSKTSASS
jgi:hypothetical protein